MENDLFLEAVAAGTSEDPATGEPHCVLEKLAEHVSSGNLDGLFLLSVFGSLKKRSHNTAFP